MKYSPWEIPHLCVHSGPVFGCQCCINRAKLSPYTYPTPTRHGVPLVKPTPKSRAGVSVATALAKLEAKLGPSPTFRLTLVKP